MTRPWDKISFPKRKATFHIIVHCSATPAGRHHTAADIHRWHLERGFRAIGYHFVIQLDGTIETGRPQDTVGAHCENYNSTSVGICLIGGVDANDRKKAVDTFTPAQKTVLAGLIDSLMKQYPRAVLNGHRDLDKRKACPSFDVGRWYRDINLKGKA